MADEELIQEAPAIETPEQEQPQEPPQEGPGPAIILSDDHKKILAGALLKMKAAKATPEKLKLFATAYAKKYGQEAPAGPAATTIPKEDYRQIPREPVATEGSAPAQQTANRLDINQDPESVARRQRYTSFREGAIKDIESPEWKDKIFQGKVPALTDNPNMPVEAFQKVDPKAVDDYLSTKDINNGEKYWLRNQILNYGKFRQSQYYVQQRAQKKIAELPEDEKTNQVAVNRAYQQAGIEQNAHETEAVANRLNNIGLDDKPLRGSVPFHDQITGANKALMGVMNFVGDIGGQVSSLLELGNVPGLSKAGYMLKTSADDMKSHYQLPQNGEAGNFLAGEILPAFLNLSTMAMYAKGPTALYQSLRGAQATSTLGKFAEGAIGGVAVSPVNSYMMAHQYYNQQVQQGEDPSKAASKADQLLSKNLLTDMLMTPVQFGLMKLPMGNAGGKILSSLAEGGVAGLHFTLQDFNQKSTENPALHVLDYIKSNEWVSPMLSGAALGMFQKGAVDALHNWSVNSKTRNMFSYGRKYGTDVRTSLPSNETIAGNVLSAFEMKDVPKRAQELKDLVNAMGGTEGIYHPHEQERINSIIDDVAAVKDQVPKFGTPMQKMAIFNELLNMRSADEFIGKAGNEAGEKFVKQIRKVSEERIQRIMNNEEPLYFVNGNETNKEQLLDALEKNPELLNSKGVRIDVRNDPSTIKKIEELKANQDAIQKQSAAAPDVRPAPGDSEAVGGRDEGQRAIDQEIAREEAGTEEHALNEEPGAEHVAADIENGKTTTEDLTMTIQKTINETKESLQRLPEGDPVEAGGDQAHEGPGQRSEETGATSVVPEAEQGRAPGNENQSAEPLPGDTGAADQARVVHEAGMPDLYTKEFFKEDVMPAIKQLGLNLKDGAQIIAKAFSPRSGVAEKALTHIMRALGDRQKSMTKIDGALHSIEKGFNKMPEADRIAFIDNLKTGRPQASPELDHIAKMIRTMDKALYDEIIKYKPTLPWLENHFRVLWKTIPGSAPNAKDKIWSLIARRPFEGDRGFMKKATLKDMSEGIARGGVPTSTNPITMFKLAYADGMKYVTAQRAFEGLKKNKFVQFVRQGSKVPDGFVRLNDRMANVYFKTNPEETLQSVKDQALIDDYKNNKVVPPGHVEFEGEIYKVLHKPGAGPIKTGEYYIDAGAGRLLNNHLSRDYIREAQIGRGLLALKNMYTAVELGFSAYHAMAEGLEAISSQIGVGLRQLINLRQFKEGAKSILTSPVAPYTTASLGRKAMRFTRSEDFRKSPGGREFLKQFPDADQYVDDFFHGGGLMKQSEDLKAKTMGMFKEQFGKNNYIGATVRAIPSFHEWLVSPLFDTFIPRLKVGMFFKEFPVLLQENAGRLAKGTVTREQLARKTIDFIDDRLGEMNFDNLFWNRTFKTAQQFLLRSVTWKLGNVRAMLGVGPEAYQEIKSAAINGHKVNLPPKLAWLLGLAAMTVTLASLIQHMLAHKGLESGKDIIAPQINPDDPDERVMIPTYFKDMAHLGHSPVGYVTTSMSGQLSKVYDLWQNKDFYGYEIVDPHDSKLEQAEQTLLYIAPKPFSFSSLAEMRAKGEPPGKQAMSFLGLNKAPGWLTHTAMENKVFDLFNIRNAGTKPHDQKESNKVKNEIRQLYRDGKIKDAHDAMVAATKEGLIRKSQAHALLKSTGKMGNAAAFLFSRLPFEDRAYLFDQMDDEEKKQYDPKGKLKHQLDQMQKDKEKQ